MAKWKSAPVPEEQTAVAEETTFALPSLADGIEFGWTQIGVFGIDVPTAAFALPVVVGALYLTIAGSRKHVDRRVLRHHDGSGAAKHPQATPFGQ
ncbi:MAG: hypothetical protein AAGH68_15255 [Pseudomonadota bacterium]